MMIQTLMIHWFKYQGGRAAKDILKNEFTRKEINLVLSGYWQRYLILKKDVPIMPNLGGKLMLNLAAFSTAFYQEIIARGKNHETTTKLFYDIAWQVYIKMGTLSWFIAKFGSKNNFTRLKKATDYFRIFPFNSPTYEWTNESSNGKTVCFDCVKCPVADFCANTWCALDYPLAELWNAKLERSGSIAGGAEKCDFKWIARD